MHNASPIRSLTKSIKLSLALAALTTPALFAKPSKPLTEGVWVSDTEYRYFPMIKGNKDFVVDHRKAKGFELYGPQGLKKWLDENHIPYKTMNLVPDQKIVNEYPSFEQIEAKLVELNHKYPQLTQLVSIGQSVRGKKLYFLKISKNAAVDARLPEFKYVSSMHGDEITGRELMVSFATDLLSAYGVDPAVTELINNTEIYIMPSMNPDGSEMRQRFNANSADLNRDFPDFTSDPTNTTNGREIETVAMMKFQESRNFALSANFHGGSEVINYPWDTSETPHPFDTLIQSLSLSYAQLVPYIFNSGEFPNGITNGFTWYEVNGGMQDWSEFYYNDLQITVELSGSKWPRYSLIPGYYQSNKPALLQFIKDIHQGAGFYFASGRRAKKAGKVSIQRAGKEIGSYNFRNGEFYRVLEPGLYDFVVKTSDNKTYSFNQLVKADTVTTGGNYKVLN